MARMRRGVQGFWEDPFALRRAELRAAVQRHVNVHLLTIVVIMCACLLTAISLGYCERRAKEQAIAAGGGRKTGGKAARRAAEKAATKEAEAAAAPCAPGAASEDPGGAGDPSGAGKTITVSILYRSTFRLLRTWLTDPRTKWTARGVVLGLFFWWLWREYAWAFLASAFHARVTNEITTVPQHRDLNRVWHAILTALLYDICLGLPTFSVLDRMVSYYTRIRLRDFMTNRVLNSYLMGNHAYYHIKLNESENGIDNPDQRITEDVNDISSTIVSLWGSILSTVLGFSMWTSVIFGLGGVTMVQVSLAFASFRTAIAWYGFGRSIVAARIRVMKEQASMRYGLTRVRDSAEEIALGSGHDYEHKHIFGLYLSVANSLWRLTSVEIRYGMALSLCDLFPTICLWVVLLPKLVSGEIGYGDAMRVHMGYDQVSKVFGFFVNNFGTLTDLHANAERLQILLDACEASTTLAAAAPGAAGEEEAASAAAGGPRIRLEEAPPGVALELARVAPHFPGLSRAPGGGGEEEGKKVAETALPGVSLVCPAGQAVLIMGPSGCGKTSLLRSVAGLWVRGSGAVRRPGGTARDCLEFLPGRSYLPIGSLQQLVCYPRWLEEDDTSEEANAKEALVRARLDYLIDRWGLRVQKDWRALLSAGEQQRLGFARLFWQLRRRGAAANSNSVLAVLDEATSALDVETEAALYKELRAELRPGGGLRGIASVGHRPQLEAFHDTWLLLGDAPGPAPENVAAGAEGHGLREWAGGRCLSPGGETMRWRQLAREERPPGLAR